MVGLNAWRWRVAAAAAAVALGLAGAVPVTAPAAAYAEATSAPAASEEQGQIHLPESGQGWHREGTTIVIDGALPKWPEGDAYINGPVWEYGSTYYKEESPVTAFDIRPGASAKTLYHFFANLKHLKSIKGLKNLKIDGVTNMSGMFSGTKYMPGDLKDLDFSSVTNISGLFAGCEAPAIDMEGIDTSHVTDMSGLFTRCSASSISMKGIDTSHVTDMSGMFSGYKAPVIDMRGIDTSHVTNMSAMFDGTSAKSYLISGMDTSRVTDMSYMFADIGDRENIGTVDLDLSGFDTSHVTNMESMFEGSVGIRSLNLSSFDTSQVIDMELMMEGPSDMDLGLRSVVMGPKMQIKNGFGASGYFTIFNSYTAMRLQLRPAYPQTGGAISDPSDFQDYQNGVKSAQLYVAGGYASVSVDGEAPSRTQVLKEGEKAARPADPKREGYTFQGWYSDAKLTKAFDFNAGVTGDVKLYPKWVANTYTVSFDANGGSAVASQKAEYGKAVAKPADPTRSGYTFAGWYADAALTKAYDFKAAVKGNVALYAKWKANVYTVSFDAAGGPAVASQKVEYGKAATKPADPTRSGYTFGGWYADAKLTRAYDFKVAVSGDLTLYAKWTKNPAPAPKTFTVTFNSNGGSAVASQKVTEGKAVTKPADPTRSGYTFQGWFSDSKLTKAYDFKAAVKADATLCAKWSKSPAPAPAPRPSDQFTDVTGASTWVINQGYLDYAVSHNLMTGYKTSGKPNGLFGPTDTLTRGQVAVVLYRVATGRDSGDGQTGFKDQGAYPYYRTAIRWLKDAGLATGDRDPVTQAPLNTFRPDDPITRQELATLVYRFALKRGVKADKVDTSSISKFRDGSEVMPYAREAVAWCNSAKVITGGQGADAGKLMPLDNAQRAQAAKIFTVLHRDVLKLGK